ncbi:MAG: AzlD domain-containing protein [Christensenellales bacterium]
MRLEVVLAILGMALATYVTRALPAVFWEKFQLTPRVEKFLKLIPYTAMSALVFPGVFSVDPANWHVGAVGALVAVLLSWNRVPLALVVLGAVLSVMTMHFLF